MVFDDRITLVLAVSAISSVPEPDVVPMKALSIVHVLVAVRATHEPTAAGPGEDPDVTVHLALYKPAFDVGVTQFPVA